MRTSVPTHRISIISRNSPRTLTRKMAQRRFPELSVPSAEAGTESWMVDIAFLHERL